MAMFTIIQWNPYTIRLTFYNKDGCSKQDQVLVEMEHVVGQSPPELLRQKIFQTTALNHNIWSWTV